MLKKQEFTRWWFLLESRFNRKTNLTETIGQDTFALYFETVQHLTSDEFEQAAKTIFREDNFFPAPQRFLDLAKGADKKALEQSWNDLLEIMSRYGHREGFTKLTEEQQAVLRTTNHVWHKLVTANEYKQRELKQEYISKLAEARLAVPTSNAKALEGKKEIAS